MNKPVPSAPLTLLLGDALSEAGPALRSFLDSDSGFSVANRGFGTSPVAEIIYQGVSFMLSLAPHDRDIAHAKPIFCNLDPALVRCAIDIRLGENVAGGERVPAIIQALLDIAQKLGSTLKAQAVLWHPANIVSGFGYFSQAVADYLASGAFPVLALVNFKADEDGVINSSGLSLLSGQELQVSPSALSPHEMMQRVVRVVHDIAVNGPVRAPVKLNGIEAGEIVELEPLPAHGLLRMTLYS